MGGFSDDIPTSPTPSDSSSGSRGFSDDNAPSGPSPFSGLAAIASGARDAAGKGFGKVVDLLDRPRQATQAGLVEGLKGGLGAGLSKLGETAIHGQSLAGSDAARAELRDDLERGLGVADAQKYGNASHTTQGLTDFVFDTLTDPLTYLGGAGLLDKGFTAATRGAQVGAVRGAQEAGRAVISAADRTRDMETALRARRAVGRVGDVLGGVHDVLTPGGRNVGAAKRALIASRGFAGLDDFAMARQIAKAGQNTTQALKSEFRAMHSDAVKGLSEAEEGAVYDAVDHGTIDALPANLRPKAEALRETYRGLRHLSGTGTVRGDLAKDGFALPERLKPFDTSVRGLQKRSQVRENYLPHAPQFTEDERALLAQSDNIEGAGLTEDELFTAKGDAQRTPTYRSTLDARDPNLRARQTDLGLADVGRQRQINLARLESGARAIGARDTSRDLARTFAPGREVMRRASGEEADVGEVYRAALSGVSADEKAAINRALQHGAIVGTERADSGLPANLQQRVQSVRDALTFSPLAEPVGTGRFTHKLEDVPSAIKLAFKPEEMGRDGAFSNLAKGLKAASDAPKYAFFVNPTRHMLNISSLAVLEDPVSAVQAAVRYGMSGEALPDFLKPLYQKSVPGAAGAAKSQAQAIDAAIKAGAIAVNPERDIPWLIDKIPVLRDVYRWSGDTLWSFDDAQKATLYDNLVKRTSRAGDSPQIARRSSALAAQRVGGSLLDYGDTSELTRKLGILMPFATYRTKLPGAVARSVARHPERTLAAARTSPALVGQTVNTDDGGTTTSSLPLGEILGATGDPAKYLRGSIGPLQKDLLSTLHVGDLGVDENLDALARGIGSGDEAPPTQRSARYFSYGKPVDAKLLLNQYLGPALGADQLLTAIGQNEFDGHGFIDDLVQGSTGSYVRSAP